MGRIARVVAPNLPHHVTQRGNRRQPTFFQDDDYRLYLDLLAEECRRHDVAVWSYSLMPNHSHLVPVPSTEAGLAAAIGEAHRRYTGEINRHMGWTGHLWQGRFASYPLEDDYLRNVIRYVELNAVRAGLVEHAWDYPYCSAAARVLGRPDPLITLEPLQSMIEDWRSFLSLPLEEELLLRLRLHSRTGRPLGSETFLRQLEEQTGLVLLPRKRGRPRSGGDTNELQT